MKVALYIGDHSSDNFTVRAGWWLTKKAQKGPYAKVTHVEAIHEEHLDGSVTIASSSLREGGVRAKRVVLKEGAWIIVDVPSWDVGKSVALLAETLGQPYDWRGALATCLPGTHIDGRWFCNEFVGYPFIKASATFGPHHFAAIALSLGTDVTDDFFKSRKQI